VFGGGIRMFACWAAHTVSRGLLVVGSRGLLESFELAQTQGLLSEYRLVGYASAGAQAAPCGSDRAYRGSMATHLSELLREGLTDIVVSADAGAGPQVMNWVVPCLQHGCRVTNEAVFYEKATGQILVDEITPAWFLFADLKVHCEQQATLKRVVDLMAAALLMVLSVVLWPFIALAVKLCDGGPVIYSQQRVGQNGRVFTLYKFRTMRPDAENGKSVWSSPNDPRVTPVGRWLRQTRFDELPQLWNVLKGDMSLVGPRPERPDLVADLARAIPYYSERHLVKPGVTGWAQISFRYGSSAADAKRKLQFDLYYLKHMSFELDMIILFRTLGTFLRGAC
jgi:exopolysaccharide biosynthesis polyprenyl glycosylphosphotransferase